MGGGQWFPGYTTSPRRTGFRGTFKIQVLWTANHRRKRAFPLTSGGFQSIYCPLTGIRENNTYLSLRPLWSEEGKWSASAHPGWKAGSGGSAFHTRSKYSVAVKTTSVIHSQFYWVLKWPSCHFILACSPGASRKGSSLYTPLSVSVHSVPVPAGSLASRQLFKLTRSQLMKYIRVGNPFLTLSVASFNRLE